MKQLLLVFISLGYFISHAQVSTPIHQIEDSLASWSSIFLVNQVDTVSKFRQLKKFTETLTTLLETEEGKSYPFNKLKSISIISPSDNAFRIFTWFIITPFGYKPFGLIQLNNPFGRKKISVINLTALSEEPKGLVYKTLDAEHWPGLVYYNIVPVKKGKTSYYLLVGFHGNNGLTQKKSIDVISFTSSGQVRFGLPVFMTDQRMSNRLIFEYKAQANMSLRYIEKQKMFVFDHLSPEHPSLKGQYQYYVPDFSYDAYKLEKHKWVYVADVYTKNDTENKGQQGIKHSPKTPDK
ncbi:MAG: hypothetical protein LC101_08605 [Flavobacteriales bacterium]|nr:hypothetical protein [Flavobacteriales bacterium]